jgi:hypothetical protein
MIPLPLLAQTTLVPGASPSLSTRRLMLALHRLWQEQAAAAAAVF